jgi:hypothetical protein
MQKMIEMKMSMSVTMSDGDAQDKTSIQNLFALSKDLQTQLHDIGLEERVSNPIILSVLSSVATSMGLSNGKICGEVESDYMNQNIKINLIK